MTSFRRVGAASTFAGAVLFRVALFFSNAITPTFETADSYEYRWLADSLLKHGVFGWDGVPKMNRTPGYPAFLAIVFALFGRSQLAITGAQVALDALTCAMIFDLAVRLKLSRVGAIVTACFAATCVFTASLSFQLMTETLYTFGIVVSVWVLPVGSITTLFQKKNRLRLALSGLAVGCTSLVRPVEAFSFAAFVAIVAIVLVRRLGVRRVVRAGRWKALVLPLVVVTAGVCLALVPWMARNRIVFHWEYEKPNHDHVTLLGYKTDIPVYRHWYSHQFTYYRRSYEEPMVMQKPYFAPTIARYVYPEERKEVGEAFDSLSAQIIASETEPIRTDTLDMFQRIGEKRYAAAPRLYVTAPASRAAKLWIAPRASILLPLDAGNVPLATTVFLVLYDLVYVVPGLLGLLLGFRLSRTTFAASLAAVLAHTAMHTFWHSSPHSRYMVPLFPLICLGVGVVFDRAKARFYDRTRLKSER